jgi:prophage regulatory protein
MPPSRKIRKDLPPELLEDGLLRKAQVLAVIPVGERSWDRGVAEGRFPKPVRLSARIRAWRVADIRAWLASLNER